ncbi:MAG: YbhB/YbcL family Raf kinase inhibitor-like protein [Candidatus Omnitrophica bacterium]|nr:YbhB/YbcL family Raf kinase inhibitor-like protein [Candidatus Omnitrophota bacterium]
MSPTFENNIRLPEKYTCQGINVSPPLVWANVPDKTRSIAVICEDPDALRGVWIHWLVYDIPPESRKLEEAIPLNGILGNGAKQGLNDFGNIGYQGPCPPSGKEHRYFFKLYCLDKRLNLAPGITKSILLKEMEGHIISESKLINTWGR